MTRFSALSLAAAILALAAPAFAGDMNFYMKNQQDRGVAVELHSRDRNAVWPGGDQVYFLEGRQKKSVKVACQEGEKICYGAWINGDDSISFGVGPDNDKPPCEYCCFICVDKSTQVDSISK
jgi:hypothetical protein